MNRHIYLNSTARDLGIIRFTVFAIWLIIITLSPITSYSYLPVELFQPLGIFSLIFPDSNSFFTLLILSETFLFFLKYSLILGIILCMVGFRPFSYVAIPTVLLLFLIDGIIKGFGGFVNHAELGILYTTIILALFRSSDGFSIFNKRSDSKEIPDDYYTLPILLIALTLTLAYSFIGIHRFLYGGVEQFFNDSMFVHLTVNSLNYSKFSFDFGLLIVESKYLLTITKIGFLAVTIFEIASPFILLFKALRYLWLIVIIPFHLLSLFLMNIFFWENLILIILLFVYLPQKKSPD